MDSMRSLNTSLPSASSSRQPPSHPQDDREELLQAFKVAALSVTKLYKTAANDQSRARAEGYQDALDDLLAFLDKENLGLSDGEGWRVRRWATERLDGRELPMSTDSEDDVDKRERSASPVLRRQSPPQPAAIPTPAPTAVPVPAPAPVAMQSTPVPSRMPFQPQPESPAPPSVSNVEQPANLPLNNLQPPTGNFTFRSPHFLSDLSLGELNLDGQRNQEGTSPHSTAAQSITVARPTRSGMRHNHNARHGARTSNTLNRSAAGQKRKINIGDFFDISNVYPGKDGFGGGGKRGRFA